QFTTIPFDSAQRASVTSTGAASPRKVILDGDRRSDGRYLEATAVRWAVGEGTSCAGVREPVCVGSDGQPAASRFHRPPSEPASQVFRVSGSPVDLFDGLRRSPCRSPGMDRDVASLPRSSMMSSVVSASRMSRTSTSYHQVHLSPFALCPAFPDADSYGD